MRIENTKWDEVYFLHPQILTLLRDRNYEVQHHVKLVSGSIIDIVASYEGRIYIIECKLRLTKANLYQAIGQVLCYVSEYNNTAIPVIASYTTEIDEYAYQCCQRLGIEILEVKDE